MKTRPVVIVGLLLISSLSMAQPGPPVIARGQRTDCQTFAETGKVVCGRFLEYWLDHGDLAQQGLPLSDTFMEQSPTDGKTYIVQYFERAIFEYHPNNAPPYDVQLSLLGVFRLRAKYNNKPPLETPSKSPNVITIPQTSKKLGGAFLTYWLEHGSVAQQGYPISNEFIETSDLDGKPYLVQYFERAVFEYHPDQIARPYVVLLSQLGAFRFRERGSGGGVPADAPPMIHIPATVASHPPKDAVGYARYLAKKYNRIGGEPLVFQNTTGKDLVNNREITLEVDTATFLGPLRRIKKSDAQVWAYTILNEASDNWPGQLFRITLEYINYTDSPCTGCTSDCYYVGHDPSGRGKYEVITFASISESVIPYAIDYPHGYAEVCNFQ